jgi:hypothetical protein
MKITDEDKMWLHHAEVLIECYNQSIEDGPQVIKLDQRIIDEVIGTLRKLQE